MKVGLVLIILGVLLWASAYGRLRAARSESMSALFPTRNGERMSYNTKANITGEHFIYLSCKREPGQLPSDFANWKTPPAIACDVRIAVTNLMGAILETNCRSLMPAIWRNEDVLYYVADFPVGKTGPYTISIENRTNLNVFEGREPTLQIEPSAYLLKTRGFYEIIARIIGGVLGGVGLLLFTYTVAKRNRQTSG